MPQDQTRQKRSKAWQRKQHPIGSVANTIKSHPIKWPFGGRVKSFQIGVCPRINPNWDVSLVALPHYKSVKFHSGALDCFRPSLWVLHHECNKRRKHTIAQPLSNRGRIGMAHLLWRVQAGPFWIEPASASQAMTSTLLGKEAWSSLAACSSAKSREDMRCDNT